jgi:hypothetical protein
MQQITQLSLYVENRPGALAEICRILKQNKINIRTLSLADTQQFGILRMLVDDPDNAKNVLEKAGMVVKLSGVLALVVPDNAGGLADILEIFDKHQLAVEYMYAFTFGKAGKAVMVFCFTDADKALGALANEAVEVLDAAALN